MAHDQLDFHMQTQEHDKWCWAATAASTARFYDSNSNWTQCLIASELFIPDCCQAACNVSFYLEQALGVVSHLDFMDSDDQSLSTIQTEIDNKRPLGCGMTFGGSNHFVMIVGYDTTANSVDVADPWYGSTDDVPYSVFLNQYQSIKKDGGTWATSYFTKDAFNT